MKRIEVLGCPLDVASMDETVSFISERVSRREFTQHVVVNVAKLVNMRTDPQLAASVHCCDVINIDGMGVVWGARVLGHDVPERVTGVDLFDRLLGEAALKDFPVYFLGATDDVVQAVAIRSVMQYPRLIVAGHHHGYFWGDEEAIVKRIQASGARMLFVAITSPKKEKFINQWKAALGVDFVMGVGGTFDVVAGKVKRAPLWMQRAGLEWLFRLLQEPRRMFARYLVTNSKFALMLGEAWVRMQVR